MLNITVLFNIHSLRLDQDGVRCDTFHLVSDQLEAQRSTPTCFPGLYDAYQRRAITKMI
jgi:hypothetical protein